MAITNYAESWTDTYSRYLGVVNFIAGDYDSLKTAIRQYVVQQNPEGYNDWAESSEVGMFVNSIAYLGETLHFRVDLSVHDLFPATTMRKQSLLNFAKMLSYASTRNICANGIAKLKSVMTTQDITDSSGNNLKNITINWNDSSNEDWQEQFLIIMNNAFTKNNYFGKPAKTSIVDGITTQVYKFNNLVNQSSVYPFSALINGFNVGFDVVNPSIDLNSNSIYEKTPIPEDSFNILYRNDGSGNGSKNTGFFVYWKQGVLKSKTYTFTEKRENIGIEIDDENINNNDVWFEQIDSATGYVDTIWTQIKPNEYLSYNSTDAQTTTIYKVETAENDKIKIYFSDGYFGQIPYGTYRLWYRVSSGNSNYYIKPSDLQDISVTIPYYNNRVSSDTNVYYLTITFSVQDVSHIRQSVPSESITTMKNAMPSVYSTQNRMVTARDYNSYPKSIGEQLRVLKSVLRTYSGNSRYIKLNDPTGTYSEVNVLATDGYLYGNNSISKSSTVSEDIDATSLIDKYILPKLSTYEMQNLYYENYNGYFIPQPVIEDNKFVYKQFKWVTESVEGNNKCVGYFVNIDGTKTSKEELVIMADEESSAPIELGDFLIFTTDDKFNYTSNSETVMAKVIEDPKETVEETYDENTPDYRITLSEVLDVNKTWYLRTAKYNTETSEYETNGCESNYHSLQQYFTEEFVEELYELLTEIKDSFGITYDADNREWMIIFKDYSPDVLWDAYKNHTETPVMIPYNDGYVMDCIFDIQYKDNNWQFNSRMRKYTFGSKGETAFFFNTYKKDGDNGFLTEDYIKIMELKYNTGDTIGEEFYIKPYNLIRYSDGYIDPYKFYARSFDGDNDDANDNPLTFKKILLNKQEKIIFLKSSSGELSELSYLDYINLNSDSVFGSLYQHTLETGYFYTHYLIKSVLPQGHIVTAEDLDGAEALYEPKMEAGETILLSNGKPCQFRGESHIEGDILEYDYVNFVSGFDDNGNSTYFGEDGYLYYYDGYTKTLTLLEENKDYIVEYGLTNLTFLWKHEPTSSYIIDPCSSNFVDMFVLTNTYYNEVQNWINGGKEGQFPRAPSSFELSSIFKSLEDNKMISDNMIWHPVRYKLLFGDNANIEDRAIFKVIKTSDLISDNEIKKAVVDLIDNYFSSMEVGETFYFTKMATYIHNNLSNYIDTVLIVPADSDETFGQLFQVACDENEILLSSATMDNIQVISNITPQNIRMTD